MSIKLLVIVVIFVLVGPSPSFGYRPLAHKAINRSAITQKITSEPIQTFFATQLGYLSAASDVNGKMISIWFEDAGEQEDKPFWRTRHHFLDPVNNRGICGLFNLCDPAVIWAQKAAGGQGWMDGGNHSWQDAREYFHAALTTDTKELREQKLTDSFRALGQVMHLMADMSVPEHTRDNSHILTKTIEPWLEEVLNPLTKTRLYASYNARMTTALNNPIPPDFSLLQQAGLYPGAPIPIANLFDFEKYTGSNPGVTTTAPIGLAEYTNANFLSADTIFKNYNYPSETEVIELRETDPATGEIRTFYSSAYVDHLVQTNVFHKYLGSDKTNGYVLENDKVHADYMDKLIPRAVGYAGALVEYFYRGTIKLSLPNQGVYSIAAPNSPGYTEIRVKAQNSTATNEEMTDGTLQLVVKYKMALSDPFQSTQVDVGPEQYIVVSEKNNVRTLSRTGTTELVFDLTSNPLPFWAVDVSLQLVYHGQLGNEAGAVALGAQDISEPTPIDVVNFMDLVCINNTIMTAGSPAAITAVDFNHNGFPDYDVYPHGLKSVYLAFNGALASSTNHSATIASIPSGNYGRVFVLGEYLSLPVSVDVTLQIPNAQDSFPHSSFETYVDVVEALDNQHYYALMYDVRGMTSWWYSYYTNAPYPWNSTCDFNSASPNIAGPVTVIIP